MTSRITPDQQAALQTHLGQPVPLEGDGGNIVGYIVGYMVDAASFLHMQGLSGEPSAENEQRLKAMIAEGIASPDVPSEEVFQELRERVKQIKQAGA